MKDTLILAHYYTIPAVQQMADFTGDSLDLAMKAKASGAKRIIFAGVRFMAETAKILCPDAEVILPDFGSTCSLVEQTDINKLKQWRDLYSDHYHVAYINSSAEHKACADMIVTSRIVEDVFDTLYQQNRKVIFSPDKNMGRYLSFKYDKYIPLWDAVCEVHDQFDAIEYDKTSRGWSDGSKSLIAHIESPLAMLDRADYVGSTYGMMDWVRKFPHKVGTIYVATEIGLLYNLKQLRPELTFIQAPTNKACACASCPYMKLNTPEKVKAGLLGKGQVIDYLSDEMMEKAKTPIERMLKFQETGLIE